MGSYFAASAHAYATSARSCTRLEKVFADYGYDYAELGNGRATSANYYASLGNDLPSSDKSFSAPGKTFASFAREYSDLAPH